VSNVLVKDQGKGKESIDDVGRYHVLGVLGEGALGRLYLAEGARADGTLERIALRRLDRKLTGEANALRLLLEGARVATTFDHKNIVSSYEIDRSDDHYYLASKYLPGESLSAILRACAESAPMRAEIAAALVRNCVEALRYVHALADAKGAPLRMLHRDLRPSNVFVTFRGDARLMGFETGASVASHTEIRMSCDGGLSYAAPEEISNGPVDVRTDLFSLGALLWECLTGRRLFGADTQAKTTEAIRTRYIEPPSVFRQDIPPSLDEIALRAVTRDPRRRYQNATEMAMALDKAIAGLEWRPTGADIANWLEELCGPERVTLKNQVFLGTAVEASLARLRLVGAMRSASPEPIDPDTDATRPSSVAETLMRGAGGPGPAAASVAVTTTPPSVSPLHPTNGPPVARGGAPVALPGLTASAGLPYASPAPEGGRAGGGTGSGAGGLIIPGPTRAPGLGAGPAPFPAVPGAVSGVIVGGQPAPSLGGATATRPPTMPGLPLGPAAGTGAAGAGVAIPGTKPRNIMFIAGVAVVAVLLLGVLWLMRSDGAAGVSSSEGAAATMGSLLVQSTPAGAQVLIDGDPSGLTTPARITGLRSGRKVNIQVDKPGYGVARQVAEVPAGGERVISLSLVESVGLVRLTGVPSHAEVYVDDVLVDAQNPISTAIGSHRLRVESAGQLYASMSINVQKGEHTIAVRPGQGSEK
jgi:serine/threonine-protein kinase